MAERIPKQVLDNSLITEAFFEGTRLLGIVAPIRGYQFCWHLNNSIGLDFRINELEIKRIYKKRQYSFAVYEYKEPTGSLEHYIYNNKFDGEFLLPEFKHLDFLWLMREDEVSDASIQQTIQIIRNIQPVQLVAELPVEQIKNKENLVF
ncbi:MAG: IPExxxVDY family protein [Bacteroidetes bacterium]|nr:IPExxxVDY family protein [Bacteroidota bacterium]